MKFSEEYFEILSEEIHNLWMLWAKALINSEPCLSEERKTRWAKCFVPYNCLSEEEKEKDRKIVRDIFNEADKKLIVKRIDDKLHENFRKMFS